MIIRRLADAKGSSREVRPENGNWVSYRLLLKEDGMGFSFHETIIHGGTETYIWYKHHLESVYCIAGEGEIKDLATGKVHPISKGTMYALDKHERHLLRAFSDMVMMCVFNPPLNGSEVHNDEGVYELEGEEEVASRVG